MKVRLKILIWLLMPLSATLGAQDLLFENFDQDPGQFTYQDDLFKATNQPSYANGVWMKSGGIDNSGMLEIELGGMDDNKVDHISGGWATTFTLTSEAKIQINFDFKINQSGQYEEDELSQVLLSIDGELIGNGNKEYVDMIKGQVNRGPVVGADKFFRFKTVYGPLAPGEHTISIGGYNSKKNSVSESTSVMIDNLDVHTTQSECEDPNSSSPQGLVNRLDLANYISQISQLSNFGDRNQQSDLGSKSYKDAEQWVISLLESYDYEVQFHNYTYKNDQRRSIYVTKLGTNNPDEMYIVTGNLDGNGGGGAADDNASGAAVVLEIARVLASPDIKTDKSVRMILWNNEETGRNGSAAYVGNRRALQGIEQPEGSGQYPEPTWLGVIQHDMLLFDHGLPAKAKQIAGADLDIEFKSNSTFANQSKTLANRLKYANLKFASDYPSEIGLDADVGDVRSFQSFTSTIVIRENRSAEEISAGANPYWKSDKDIASSYSTDDFKLGFNALQTSLGAVAELAGVTVSSNACNQLALPLELVVFEGRNDEDQNIIKWKIENAINVKSYELQKFSESLGYYETIVELEHQEGESDYAYADTDINAESSQYRIKVNDNDDAINYSKVIVIKAKANIFTTNIFPNPTPNGEVIFEFYNPSSDEALVQLYSLDGKRLSDSSLQKTSSTTYSIDLKPYGPGIYILRYPQKFDYKMEKIIYLPGE